MTISLDVPPMPTRVAAASDTAKCFFNDCINPVVPGSWKCDFHKSRGRCKVDRCKNQVYARRLCVRHGGKRQCQVVGCRRNVRLGNVCSSHGAATTKKMCTEPGCMNVAHKRLKCVRHGGGRKCNVENCKTHARRGGYCCRHTRSHGNTCIGDGIGGVEIAKLDDVHAQPTPVPPSREQGIHQLTASPLSSSPPPLLPSLPQTFRRLNMNSITSLVHSDDIVGPSSMQYHRPW
ncbi:Aste57867_267 [Aphanomyces stellatus]|uniref:Aste57867_267 protein n=1 Tax=Aphanomyces stellatus TaxID=120398 RepID=A0A485K590_9STRA|nr:hypothetical protein As57867_000267 [Aphanomyces stellatus]VFT77493.1 Aste57867_267 [Aphanomyces stellatus]